MGLWDGFVTQGYVSGWLFLILFWVVLIGVVVFLVTRLMAAAGKPAPASPISFEFQDSAGELLDRMFALGEIDDSTYRARRGALSEMRGRR